MAHDVNGQAERLKNDHGLAFYRFEPALVVLHEISDDESGDHGRQEVVAKFVCRGRTCIDKGVENPQRGMA